MTLDRGGTPVLDHPQKTAELLAGLKAAVPFEVELLPALVRHLQGQNVAAMGRQMVSDVSYAGDEGGIVCHLIPTDKREAFVVSLTHLRVSQSMPLALAVLRYQKHRVKKLKKQGGM
jgi:hypothetical protein